MHTKENDIHLISRFPYFLAVLLGSVALWGQTAVPTATATYTKEQIEAIKVRRDQGTRENALITEANTEIAAKNWAAASKALEKYLELAPNGPYAENAKRILEVIDADSHTAKLQKVNALITQATSAMNSKNWAGAIAPLQEAISLDPGNWQLYSGLGDAELNLGKFQDALQIYDKGIQAAQSALANPPANAAGNPLKDPAKIKIGMARMLANQGICYLKLKMNDQAIAAFTKAASLDPNPGTAYFNLCATQYNTGNVEGALEACDKAIAADPTKADAYFIKGSLLMAESKMDRDGRIQAPPGTVEALQKYLELAPNGPHAQDVQGMLDSLHAVPSK